MVVMVTPTPQAPRKAIGNSGMFGTIIPITSPFLAPNRNNAEPNFRAIPTNKQKYRLHLNCINFHCEHSEELFTYIEIHNLPHTKRHTGISFVLKFWENLNIIFKQRRLEQSNHKTADDKLQNKMLHGLRKENLI